MKTHTGKWSGVMLHHTATPTTYTAQQIKNIHLAKGWGDVGYHYLIKLTDSGCSIKTGRSDKYVGAHCDVGNYNNTYIGVSIIGNFETAKLNDAQFNAVCNSLKHIMNKYEVATLKGHREVKATACPGKNIDLAKIRAKIR